MASALTRLQFVQFGLHDSVTDFTGVPGTMVSLEVDDHGALPMDIESIERDLSRGDNMDYAAIAGPKMLSEIPISFPMRSIATNDGAALDAQTETDFGLLMDSICGASTDKGGSATTITGDTGSSATLTVTSGADFANGGGILFMDGNGDYVAREIVSGGGTGTLVLDRNHTDGAPGSDNIPYGSVYWTVAPGTAEHTHGTIRAVGGNWERTFFGCAGQASFEIRERQPVRFVSRWLPTDWSDTTAAPSFSAPTAGDFIMGINSKLYVGNDALLLKSATLNLGYTLIPRETVNGPNGVQGYIVTRKAPVLEGMLYVGPNGVSFGEVQDSTGNISINKIQGLTNSAGSALNTGVAKSTYDCALQVGAGPGRTLYIRMPAAEFTGQVVNENGIEMVRFQLKARRPSSGSPCRIHLL